MNKGIFHSGDCLWKLAKAVRLGFCPLNSKNIHTEESKKQGFNFSIELRVNSKIFRVIS